MTKRTTWTTSTMIEKFKSIHGDKFDYSKFIFTKVTDKGLIKCNSCGIEWLQSPAAHKLIKQCQFCGLKNTGLRSQADVIKTFMSKFKNGEYDYSEFVYVSNKKSSTIKCNKCGNKFKRRASVHMKKEGLEGCTRCILLRKPKCKRKSPIHDWLASMRRVHGDRYDFSKYKYVGRKTISQYTCLQCGVEYTRSYNGLMSGEGCLPCYGSKIRTVNRIAKFKIKYNDNFTYEGANYKGSNSPLTVTCKDCKTKTHLTFLKHLMGQGCKACKPKCNGFNPEKAGMMYYIRYDNHTHTAWKIGITNKTLKQRFREDYKNITVIETWDYEIGQYAWDNEKVIIKENKEFKYKGEPLLNRGGNSELFTKDILGLDPDYS